jgi:hypothetical protein
MGTPPPIKYALYHNYNIMLLRCKQCWKEFESPRSKRKYCSIECWHKDRQYNLLNQKYWRLTVIKNLWLDRNKWVLWLCQCECWALVKRHTNKLVNWKNQSCWCFRKTSYWLVKDSFYYKYNSMHTRCEDPKSDSYAIYWWKWIRCERKTFQDFYKDMYASYVAHCEKFWQKDTTIDRIDVNWNYCKENCRWATNKEQSNNKSNNRFVEYNWKRLTVSQWADKIWISYKALTAKLGRGVPIEWIVKHPHKRWYGYYDIEEQLKRYM